MTNELPHQPMTGELTTGDEFRRPAEWADLAIALDVPESTKLHPRTYVMAEELAIPEGLRLTEYTRRKTRGQEYIESAEDLSQTALLAFMERYHDEPLQLAVQNGHIPVLWTILKHKISDHHRRVVLRRNRMDNVETAADLSEMVIAPGVEESIVEKEVASGVLDEIMALLTHRQKRIMEMTAEGYLTEEIARELDTSPGAVRVTRHKVIKRVSRISLAEIHNKVAQDIRDQYERGHQYVDLKASDYLAPWYLASRVLASFLSHDNYRGINRRALIVCPNNALATDFRKYVGGITRRVTSDLASMDHTKATVA